MPDATIELAISNVSVSQKTFGSKPAFLKIES
jgi:hypothetical protein